MIWQKTGFEGPAGIKMLLIDNSPRPSRWIDGVWAERIVDRRLSRLTFSFSACVELVLPGGKDERTLAATRLP